MASQNRTSTGHQILESGDLLGMALDRAVKLRAAGYNPVFATDVDGTVLDNRPRTLRIMCEFAERAHIPAIIADRIGKLTPQDILYSPGENFSLVYDAAENPDINSDLSSEFAAFWFARFPTNEYQQYDVPIPGACEHLQGMRTAGISILYLTGRHEAMRPGLVSTLAHYGFPVPSHDWPVQAALKLMHGQEDVGFKRRVFQRLHDDGVRLVGYIDDNTDMVNVAAEFDDHHQPVLYIDSSVSRLGQLHARAHVLHRYAAA